MIFVTVGSSAFPRLIKKMDEIAEEIDEPVVMQTGLTRYSCRQAKCFRFLDHEDIVSYIEKSRIVVCHDGVGTILSALQFDIPIITVPRLKKFGETYFDNKGDFIIALASENTIEIVYDIDKLKSAIEHVFTVKPYVRLDKQNSLVHSLSDYLDQLKTQKLNKH